MEDAGREERRGEKQADRQEDVIRKEERKEGGEEERKEGRAEEESGRRRPAESVRDGIESPHGRCKKREKEGRKSKKGIRARFAL